ncbi:Phosphoserine phosphatase [Cohnella sp. OV330]|uniref:HAD family hydrolase n=1 Tax=Cohnella sp. OV330 TaxID=1855288 RepID=UPI0008F0A26F|nr:haloacid dehalogenase-like hydrolase [Cohnella sp. OV330]SFB49770.1 Phosphoserine phosphatase [Cohnella sp. OV330]
MRYALLDWDNTIHRGYTIYGLTDHLAEKGIVADDIHPILERIKEAYRLQEISYADYTLRTCEAFAEALAGCSLEAYRAAVASFALEDERHLFDEAAALFALLRRYRIEVYLVSGAPAEVLRVYAERLGFSGLFGFELEEQDGMLTGRVACNYGVDKARVLRMPAFQAPSSVHALSMGDAVADIPLLDHSEVSIVVGDGKLALREDARPLRFGDGGWDIRELEELLGGALSR